MRSLHHLEDRTALGGHPWPVLRQPGLRGFASFPLARPNDHRPPQYRFTPAEIRAQLSLRRLSRATARERVDCKPGLQVAGLASANLHGDRWHHRQGTVPCEAAPLPGAPKPKQKEVNPGLDSALGLDLKFQRHSRLARSPTLERAWPP